MPLPLVHEKPARLLAFLTTSQQAQSISTIAKSCSMSFVHASHLVKQLEKEGLLQTQKTGRTKHVALTPRGTEIAQLVSSLIAKLQPPQPPAAPPPAQPAQEEPGEKKAQ